MNTSGVHTHALQGSIDAHQHFWHYSPGTHGWITDDMAVIRRDFLPVDLQPVLTANGIESCVAVQADQSEDETLFLLEQAAEYDFIKGVVGWIDLRAPDAATRLAHFSAFPKFKGVRHILQGEPPSFMLQPSFVAGLQLLASYHLTYDLLLYPGHLTAAAELVSKLPGQSFVIDHLAKPSIRTGDIDQWKNDLRVLANYPNVCCKISGMVTEADMRNWKITDFTPYLHAVVDCFGIDRVMYGSDWPVCLAAGSYTAMLEIVKNYFSRFSIDEQQLFFGKNAASFYHLT